MAEKYGEEVVEEVFEQETEKVIYHLLDGNISADQVLDALEIYIAAFVSKLNKEIDEDTPDALLCRSLMVVHGAFGRGAAVRLDRLLALFIDREMFG
jgi:hypothetical protein